MTRMQTVLAVVAAVLIAFVVSAVVSLIFRLIAKREAWASRLMIRVRRPFRATLLIVATAWLIASLAIYFKNLGLARYRLDQPDNRVARGCGRRCC